MPWNPQRVVQRNGRVIRLKSPHEQVFLTTMLPAPGDLDQILGLEATLRRKILAASLYGMESGVIEGVETELRSCAQRLVDADPTLLDEADTQPEGGFVGEELCRIPGGQRYWRYVEQDGTVVSGDATILRRINPGTADRIDLEGGAIDLEPAVDAGVRDDHRRAQSSG